jgi:hypothetical protein
MQTNRAHSKSRAVRGLLVMVALIVAIGAVGQVSAQSTSLKTVRDPQNRFTIAVPSAWSVQTQSKNPSVTAKSSAPKGALPDSLEVTVYDWSKPISAQDCISESDTVLRYAIHRWKTVKQGPVTIAGQPGYSRVYDWTAANREPRQSVETCMTHASRVYVAVGTTDNTSAKVNATMPLMERAIATLKPNLTNVPPVTPSAKPGGRN